MVPPQHDELDEALAAPEVVVPHSCSLVQHYCFFFTDFLPFIILIMANTPAMSACSVNCFSISSNSCSVTYLTTSVFSELFS